MKIIVSSTGKDIDSEVADTFGRCPYFLLIDIEGKEIKNVEAIENISKDQKGGAGISAAQKVAEKDVDAVISRNIGPRALDVLKQFNIKTYNEEGMIKEVLKKYIEGELKSTE